MSPIRCPDCRRSFGGDFTFRRAHPNRRCRPPAELRGIGLVFGADQVWHRPGPTDPLQLRLPLFGRGRPRKQTPSAIFSRAQRAAEGLPRVPGSRRHEQLGLWVAA